LANLKSSPVVQLSGSVVDDRQRQALRVVAENIPGVRKIEEQFVWIDPRFPEFFVELPPDNEQDRRSS
jgi:hypothetical protein